MADGAIKTGDEPTVDMSVRETFPRHDRQGLRRPTDRVPTRDDTYLSTATPRSRSSPASPTTAA
jgi:hypothetical protein